jgi:hypothetical protein
MTDLDSTLMAKAILYALVTLDSLPEERRLPEERDDLVHVLHLMVQDPAEREELAAEVEAITGKLVDLTDWQGRDWRLSGGR